GGGATASCTVIITSATTGTTVVSATSSIPLTDAGSVPRTTNGTRSEERRVGKECGDGRMAITPAKANNAMCTNHTLTITVTDMGTMLVNVSTPTTTYGVARCLEF